MNNSKTFIQSPAAPNFRDSDSELWGFFFARVPSGRALFSMNKNSEKTPRAPGTLMDESDIARALKRIAHEIVERNRGVENLAIIGILTRGAPLSKRIAAQLEQIEGARVLAGELDIALYRDDYSTRSATPRKSEIDFDVTGKTVVLIDDVLFTGRTIRAALDALSDLGRPASVQLGVLVDRGHRELPIRADFVGKNAPTSREETVRVLVRELDGEDVVRLEKS